MSLDNLFVFVQEKWYIVLVMVLLIIVVVSIAKRIIKFIFTALIVLSLLLGGSLYVSDSGENPSLLGVASNYTKQQAVDRLMKTTNLDFTFSEGNYIVSSENNNVILRGKDGEETATLVLYGEEVTLEITPVIKGFLDGLRGESGEEKN